MRHFFTDYLPSVEIRGGLVYLDVGHGNGALVVTPLHNFLAFTEVARRAYAKWEHQEGGKAVATIRKRRRKH